jgi:2,3-bisphosphoglycerate-dependent phosphoglycerate mutase
MIKLVLVRHGKSIWNKENKFTGWTDVELSEEGIKEAKEAGKLLKENGYDFDIVYTSVLKRAIDTANLIINEMKDSDLIIKRSYKLNERHYGALQGLNKQETIEKCGEEQVKLWRRGFVKPPEVTLDDPRFPGNDPLYKDIDKSLLPLSESLKETIERVSDYYETEIKTELLNGKRIMVVAHGNSLRGLVKYIEKLSDEEIMNLEIPTGKPLIYEFDDELNVINHYYLGDKND